MATVVFVFPIGADFSDTDKLFVDQIEQDMMSDETLKKQAQNNSKKNFRYEFQDAFEDKDYKRIDQNQEIFIKMMNNDDFQKAIVNYLLERVYKGLQKNDKKIKLCT